MNGEETRAQKRVRKRLAMYSDVPTKVSAKRSTVKLTGADLRDATLVPEAMVENEVAECTVEQLDDFMTALGTSGVIRVKIAAAASYGFVETGPERVTLTDWGRMAVDPATRIQTWRKALMHVPLWRDLIEKYSAEPLPDPVEFEQELIRMGVVPTAAQRVRRTFERSVEEAGLYTPGRTKVLIRPHVEPGSPKPIVAPRQSRVTRLDGSEAENRPLPDLPEPRVQEVVVDGFAEFESIVAALLRDEFPRRGDKRPAAELDKLLADLRVLLSLRNEQHEGG